MIENSEAIQNGKQPGGSSDRILLKREQEREVVRELKFEGVRSEGGRDDLSFGLEHGAQGDPATGRGATPATLRPQRSWDQIYA